MYRYGWMLSLSLLIVLAAVLPSACQPVMPVDAGTPVDTESADSDPEIIPTTWDEIFLIGTENHSYAEFSYKCVDQYREFVCQIGVDCTVEDIPAGLFQGENPRGYCNEVSHLTIVFELNRDYNDLVLHLARAGSETTSVSIDGGEPLLVTSEMLGSRDGGVYGSYDLPLGPAQSGSHSITYAIPDDGKGNRGYIWDALSLSAR